MVSSFFGLYTGQRSLSATQTILNVISNNIANANTPGYSRQQVDLVTSSPYPQPMVGVASLPGTFGTGAEIESISRTRDSFLDAQFRLENCTLGYYDEKQYAFDTTEGILMEPSDSSISTKLDAFFNSAQELSLNPESLAVRTSFVQQAVDLSVIFNQQSASLLELRKSVVGDINSAGSIDESRLAVDIEDINGKLSNLSEINKQVITMMGNNMKPNDLLDKRDKILDELNEYLPITIDETSVGSVNVSLGANLLVSGGTVVNNLKAVVGDIDTPAIVQLQSPAGAVNLANANSLITNGKIGGILEVGSNDPSKTTIKSMLQRLDNLASQVATVINNLQSTGRSIDPSTTPPQLTNVLPAWASIFVSSNAAPLDASNISVNQNIIDDPNRIAAAAGTAGNTEVGSSANALLMAQTRNQANAGALGGATFADYHSSTASILGVQTKSNSDKQESQTALLNQLDLRRESTSGVNMDEELVDLIRFQRSFEASSRVMSTINEVLDHLINRMQ